MRRVSNDHWIVHVQGSEYSTVKIEVNLSRENARLIAGNKATGAAVLALFDRAIAAARTDAGENA